MKTLTLLALGTSALALVACQTNLQKAQQTPQRSNTEFNRALSEEYLRSSQNQYTGQVDFTGSERTAVKAMRAANNENVQPDVPGDRGLQPVKLRSELEAARSRLVNAVAANQATRPQDSARAQMLYDCWLDEAADPIFAVESQWLNDKVQNCRSQFDVAIADLERRPVAQTTTTTSPPAPMRREQSYLVFFDFDKSDLTPEAQALLRRAADQIRSGGASTIRIAVTGHADKSGTDQYNMSLSERRAQAVRSFLTGQGLSQAQIGMAARGESQPLVQTADGVREPQNRRVEINLQ